jgi:hypothetical protein
VDCACFLICAPPRVGPSPPHVSVST